MALINTSFIPLWLLLFTPVVFPMLPDAIGARAGTFVALTLSLIFLAYPKKVYRTPLAIALPLAAFIVFLLARIFISDIYASASIYDLAELFRIFGIFSLFLLGYKAVRQKPNGLFDNSRALIAFYSFLTLSLIIPFALNISSINPYYDFYITRGGRFSGISPSVNYVWFSSLLITIVTIESFKKRYLNTPLLALSLISSISALAFSGSRTGFIAFTIGVAIYALPQVIKNAKNISLTFSLVIVLLFSGDFLFDAMPERTKTRLAELNHVVKSQDASQSSSLQARINEFRIRQASIMERPIFGHGLSRDEEPYFHNSLQRSLYRYGFIGGFLEIILYTAFFIRAAVARKTNPYAVLVPPIIGAYLIASMTSPIFYELRVPYILFFIFGMSAVTYFENSKPTNQYYHSGSATYNSAPSK